MCKLVDLLFLINKHEIIYLDLFFFSQVSLLSFSVESEHTFLDYIKGG